MTTTDATTFEAGPPLSDDELAALALAADPETVAGDDAVPWRPNGTGDGLLPEWYMPAPIGVRRDWRSRAIAWTVVASIVAINATGLCVTYGRVVFG